MLHLIQPKICSLEKMVWEALKTLIGRKYSNFSLSQIYSEPLYHSWLSLLLPLGLPGVSSSFGAGAQSAASQAELGHSTCLCPIILC